MDGVLVQGWLYGHDGTIAAELDGTGAVVSRIAGPYLEKGGKLYRILRDDLRSPRLVVDVETGAVAQRLDYDEFGAVILDSNPGFQPLAFTGALYDADTGLLRIGARDYEPATGRWTSREPLFFDDGATNLYIYAGDDPIKRIDLDGLKISSTVKSRTLPPGTDHVLPGKDATTGLDGESYKIPPCEQGADGTWGFDVNLDFTVTQQFRSNDARTAPSKESPGLDLQGHEDLHKGDYKAGCASSAMNKTVHTDSFKTKKECDKANKDFEKKVNNYLKKVEATSHTWRDVNHDTSLP